MILGAIAGSIPRRRVRRRPRSHFLHSLYAIIEHLLAPMMRAPIRIWRSATHKLGSHDCRNHWCYDRTNHTRVDGGSRDAHCGLSEGRARVETLNGPLGWCVRLDGRLRSSASHYVGGVRIPGERLMERVEFVGCPGVLTGAYIVGCTLLTIAHDQNADRPRTRVLCSVNSRPGKEGRGQGTSLSRLDRWKMQGSWPRLATGLPHSSSQAASSDRL